MVRFWLNRFQRELSRMAIKYDIPYGYGTAIINEYNILIEFLREAPICYTSLCFCCAPIFVAILAVSCVVRNVAYALRVNNFFIQNVSGMLARLQCSGRLVVFENRMHVWGVLSTHNDPIIRSYKQVWSLCFYVYACFYFIVQRHSRARLNRVGVRALLRVW